MAIKAYEKSVASYTAWEASTAYILQDFRIPTVDNGLCYECTTAGISSSGVSPGEPTWPNVVGQTVQDGTVVWTCREKAEAAGPLSVTLGLGDAGGYSLKDIWVKSSGTGDFIVYGSYDGDNWRQIDEIAVPQGNRDNRHKGLQNAYPFIKVSTDLNAINEIEIVASQA